MYFQGQGVSQNFNQAFEWFSKAANQGDVNAQHNLGVMYYQGLGVVQNMQQAKKYFESACKNEDQESCQITNSIQ